eukprot:gene11098-12361_t
MLQVGNENQLIVHAGPGPGGGGGGGGAVVVYSPEGKDDGKGAQRLLDHYIDHVVNQRKDPPQVTVPSERLTEAFHGASFAEQLDSIELRNIPYRSQISIQAHATPSLTTNQKKRFMVITERIKADDASLIQVKLSNEGVDDFVLHQICSGLTFNTHLQYLILHNNYITDKGVKRLCGVLACHPRCHTLWLSANKVSDIGMRCLANLLQKNHQLRELNLSNRWPSQVWAQKEFEVHPHNALSLNPVLEKLVLSKNQIADNGAVAIAEGIKVNHFLQTLDLSDNRIGNQGMVFLSRAIAKNTTITSLITVGNPSHDHRAELLAATRNSSIIAKSAGWRKSLIVEIQDLAAVPVTVPVPVPVAAVGHDVITEASSPSPSPSPSPSASLSLATPGGGGSSSSRMSFSQMNPSPFRRTSRAGSFSRSDVEVHGRRGLTRSFTTPAPASPSHHQSAEGSEDLLDAIAKAVSIVNAEEAMDKLGSPSRLTQSSDHEEETPGGSDSERSEGGGGGAVIQSSSGKKKRVPRLSKDLGKMVSIPNIQHIGMKPVRTNVSDYGDSNEHLLYLKIATEDDPPDAKPTSLVRIGLDHFAEKEKLRAERQNIEYKRQKAVKLRDKPKQLIKETAPPPLPKKFWSYWRMKTLQTYPKGIDHTRGCTSTRLDPVVIPPLAITANEETDQQPPALTDGESSLADSEAGGSMQSAVSLSSTVRDVVERKTKQEEEKTAEEAMHEAAIASLRSLYDRVDTTNPWNRYVAYKEDLLKPEDERKLGYYRHLGFSGRYFTAGQVLAARRKEKAIQLGLLDANKPASRQENSSTSSSKGKEKDKSKQTQEPSALPPVQTERGKKMKKKGEGFVTTKLVMTIATANPLRMPGDR